MLGNPMLVPVAHARELNLRLGSDGCVGNLSLTWVVCICDVGDALVCVLVRACVQTARPDHHFAEIVLMMRLRALVKLPDVELQLAGKIAKAMELL